MKHTIVYLPHCSECGALIHGNVSFKHIEGLKEWEDRTMLYKKPTCEIAPRTCPSCGATFRQIVWPTDMGETGVNMDEYLE